jgi:hypothetical protein
MPRPSAGYRNQAGQPIPGTHDPIKRYMNSNGLIQWAYKQGKAGVALYDTTAVNIGSAVHMMAELDLKNRPMDEIDYYVEQTLPRYEDRVVAVRAFAEFRSWRAQFHVDPVVQEVPLVSERHQFGGTPDTIARIGNSLALLDFKTSKDGTVYPDMLLAMAAHGKLWIENNPGKPLNGGYHLLMLPKDGGAFRHMHYVDLDAYWEQYKLLLQAYRMDKLLSSAAALEGQAVVPSPAPQSPAAKTQHAPTAQPRPRMTYSPQPQAMSMAEMLRSYGHVEGVRA